MSHRCRYCCKSPKLPGDNFPAIRRSDRRPPICVVSITLPRSPVSLSSGDEVPHIFTRKSRLQPGEFLISSAKRLLQQNLPTADSCTATNYRAAPFGFCVAQQNAIVLLIHGHTRIVGELPQGAIHDAARLNFSSSICAIECREFAGAGWDWLWPSGSGAGG